MWGAVPEARMSPNDRFWRNVAKAGPDECWLWQGGLWAHGYGRIRFEGRQRYAHRIAYELATGAKLPPGLEACHSCDDRYPVGSVEYKRCCNPAHIWAGTHQENIADCVRKGRMHVGERSGARRHPERMSRPGGPDWALKHPGMVHYGTANQATKLTEGRGKGDSQGAKYWRISAVHR